MPRRPAAYPAAYREQIIALARAGRSPQELAKEFEPTERTIRNWLFQAEAACGQRPGARAGEEPAELQRAAARTLTSLSAWSCCSAVRKTTRLIALPCAFCCRYHAMS